jgi:hypothetical protein
MRLNELSRNATPSDLFEQTEQSNLKEINTFS